MTEKIYALLFKLLEDQHNVTIKYHIVNESEVKNERFCNQSK